MEVAWSPNGKRLVVTTNVWRRGRTDRPLLYGGYESSRDSWWWTPTAGMPGRCLCPGRDGSAGRYGPDHVCGTFAPHSRHIARKPFRWHGHENDLEFTTMSNDLREGRSTFWRPMLRWIRRDWNMFSAAGPLPVRARAAQDARHGRARGRGQSAASCSNPMDRRRGKAACTSSGRVRPCGSSTARCPTLDDLPRKLEPVLRSRISPEGRFSLPPEVGRVSACGGRRHRVRIGPSRLIPRGPAASPPGMGQGYGKREGTTVCRWPTSRSRRTRDMAGRHRG